MPTPPGRPPPLPDPVPGMTRERGETCAVAGSSLERVSRAAGGSATPSPRSSRPGAVGAGQLAEHHSVEPSPKECHPAPGRIVANGPPLNSPNCDVPFRTTETRYFQRKPARESETLWFAASTLRPSPGRKTATAAARARRSQSIPGLSGGPCGPSNAPPARAIEYPAQPTWSTGRSSRPRYPRLRRDQYSGLVTTETR